MRRLLPVLALLLAGSSGRDPNCVDYVACYVATGGARQDLDATYGETGVCWTSSRNAERCMDECRHKLTMLRAAHPDAGCAEAQWPRGCSL